MSWLKDVVVDIIVTAAIVTAVVVNEPILSGFIIGYTILMLIVKITAYWGGSFSGLANKSRSEAPAWFSHLLYAIDTGTLLTFGWWLTATGWALIWLLSFLSHRKMAG